MSLIVRPYEDRDSDGFWHVRDMTYNDGIPTETDKREVKTHAFVAEEGGRVVGTFSVLDLTCTIGNRAELKCAGIAAVAVTPEHRHLGVGSAMMRWSIPYLKSQGYQVASLYAFRETFYRKFGYEVCGQRFELDVPTHRLPRIKPELPVRTISWQDHSQLQECHEAFARRYSGMNIRTDQHWARVLNEKKTIYAVGDSIEAYAILGHSWEFWVPQLISEIAWSSVAGYRSLMAVLTQISINKTSLKWYEPSDSPYLQMFADQGIVAQDARRIMFRLLDVPGAFSALRGECVGAISMEVKDDLLPENAGPWRVESDGFTMRCGRVDSGDLHGSIQAWTQALLGDPGVERGSVTEKETGALAAAGKLLPKERAYCLEFF